jgi:signal transduction histidine kinase
MTETLEPHNQEEYVKMLGCLGCAAAVPLNGRHHTYGVLEAINKVDKNGKCIPEARFKLSDMLRLSVIAMATSAALTVLRTQDQLALLATLSAPTTHLLDETHDPQTTYESVAAALTGPLTSYKVCIIRIGRPTESLELTARAGNVVWDEHPEHQPGTRTLYERVFTTGLREVIPSIAPRAQEFRNPQWIQANGLKSYACFPITFNTRVLGTLSLYTGYDHEFDESELIFIEQLVFLLAALTESFHAVGAIILEDLAIADEQSHILSGARAVSYDRIVTELRHSHKRFLASLKDTLELVARDVGGRAGRMLEAQIHIIEEQIHSILDQFATSTHSRVNVNHIVQGVLKSFSKELHTKRIHYDLTLSSDVPDIEASDVEVRDVVVNLVTNAIKAIEAARQKQGIIEVTTRIGSLDRRETLDLTVEDNGCGVRNEDLENIFKYGFSRYPGGSGVGLFVTNKIVENYDGRIVVDSTVGKGSLFTVRIPLKRLRID